MKDMAQQERGSEEPSFEVVWPLGKTVMRPHVDLAPPLADLDGKTIGEMWNWKFRGDQIYAMLNEELRKRYPNIKIVSHMTMGDTHDTNERAFVANLPELLRQHGCDAVISNVGA